MTKKKQKNKKKKHTNIKNAQENKKPFYIHKIWLKAWPNE